MTENEINNNEEVEINLAELFQLLKSKYKSILFSIFAFALAAGLITNFLISPKYESTSRLFLNSANVEGDYNLTQINTNKAMVNNYIWLLKGNTIQNKVARELNLDMSVVKNSISISNPADTQIIVITAKTTDPKLSKELVETLVEVFKEEGEGKYSVDNIIISDEAMLAEDPVSPSLKKNVVIGALLGAFVSVGILFVKFMLDTRIHNKEEAEKYLGVPSLGAIPNFED